MQVETWSDCIYTISPIQALNNNLTSVTKGIVIVSSIESWTINWRQYCMCVWERKKNKPVIQMYFTDNDIQERRNISLSAHALWTKIENHLSTYLCVTSWHFMFRCKGTFVENCFFPGEYLPINMSMCTRFEWVPGLFILSACEYFALSYSSFFNLFLISPHLVAFFLSSFIFLLSHFCFTFFFVIDLLSWSFVLVKVLLSSFFCLNLLIFLVIFSERFAFLTFCIRPSWYVYDYCMTCLSFLPCFVSRKLHILPYFCYRASRQSH